MCAKIRDGRRKYRGAYLTHVDGHPVFSLSDAERLLSKARDTSPKSTAPHLTLVVSPDVPPSNADVAPCTLQLRLDQFCTVINTLCKLGEGTAMPDDVVMPVKEFEIHVCSLASPEDTDLGTKWK
jgi:hypothetical protein